ncbi:hypothetical protein D3C81_1051640 [compost metagenome]
MQTTHLGLVDLVDTRPSNDSKRAKATAVYSDRQVFEDALIGKNSFAFSIARYIGDTQPLGVREARQSGGTVLSVNLKHAAVSHLDSGDYTQECILPLPIQTGHTDNLSLQE